MSTAGSNASAHNPMVWVVENSPKPPKPATKNKKKKRRR